MYLECINGFCVGTHVCHLCLGPFSLFSPGSWGKVHSAHVIGCSVPSAAFAYLIQFAYS